MKPQIQVYQNRTEVRMNKYFKRLRAAFAMALFVLLSFSTSFLVSASDVKKPRIDFDIDPRPVVATVVLIFGLLVAVILALTFLVRHISNAKNRIYRLSKIKSEDTVQLYDDLEEEKWVNEQTDTEKPRDIRIDDNSKKPLASKSRASTSLVDDEDQPHGPIPERDMPGYDPRIYGSDDEIETVSPYAPQTATPNVQQPVQNAQPATQRTQPVAQSYAPQAAQPIVYRPDSEVEIIMNDTTSGADDGSVSVMCNLYPDPQTYVAPETVSAPASEVASVSDEAEAAETAPTRVRAYRRRGKVPGLVKKATLNPAYQAYRRPAPTVGIAEEYEFGTDEQPHIPNLNFRHMSITPRSFAPVQEYETVSESGLSEDVTLKLQGLTKEAPVKNPEPIREAPILDINKGEAEQGESEVNVRLVSKFGNSETSVRTLNDVLDELGSADDDVIEIEATEKPAFEEELVFLGNSAMTDDVDSADDIFADEEGEARMFVGGKYANVRYKTSFLARFIQSEEKLQDYYSVLKNVLMSYKGIESSLGWTCETFTYGTETCAKINVVDKMLLLYLALDPERYHNYKYHYSYTAYKYKGSKVPMFVKIKSERALKYAIELIMALMRDLTLESVDMPDIDYRRPYETVPGLIDRGLIKIVASNGKAVEESSDVNTGEIKEKLSQLDNSEPGEVDNGAVFDFEDSSEPMVITIDEPDSLLPKTNEVPATEAFAPAFGENVTVTEESSALSNEEQPINVIHADAQNADLLLTDEEAIARIELVDDAGHNSTSGKMCEVNLDSICAAFNDGDTVNLETLKAKRLVGQSAGRIKVLARGTMTKTLTIYADRFSLQAVKMITLAGGHAEQYK